MKIAGKIALGYAVLIALIFSVLAYQIFLIHNMQSINRALSGINFQAAGESLELLRDLELIEEFTRKYLATEGDPEYGKRVQDMRDGFGKILGDIKSLPLSPAEEQEIGQLDHLWSQFLNAVEHENEASQAKDLKQLQAALNDQLELLVGSLEVQAQSVMRVTRTAIGARVSEAAAAGQRAEKVAADAALGALLASVLVSVWIVRSISTALKQLTAGTRAVAEGKFFYQLDGAGSDELAQLARDFNTMTRRLGELDEMKKDFVSHVSHELKTPLASMQETIQLLLEQIPGPLTARQQRLLELNKQSGERLSAMIRNLLDLSRMEAGVMEYQFKKHDLAELIRTTLDEFSIQARDQVFVIEEHLPDQPVWVECDGDRIIQVIGNLLGNAKKFAAKGSVIRVSLQQTPEIPRSLPEFWRGKLPTIQVGGGYALLSVADVGPGIPDHEKERIFEKFHRVKRDKKAVGQGTGLGLAIGRTIVEAHRGAIWVEDNPGGGSVFQVLLAVGAVAAETERTVSSPI